MATNPILVLQMQRMGDMVLSFPLLGWLKTAFPGHPVWVIGEQKFFEPLMPISPTATFFSYGDTSSLQGIRFHAVINLSHREKASRLAGQLKTDALFGPYSTQDSRQHIAGDWQLYRASLTHNNRYNRFHWADLNALGIIPAEYFTHTHWPQPRPFSLNAGLGSRVGLFLGASEETKRPDPPFWIALTKQLLHEGVKPVFLGGKDEVDLGQQVAAGMQAPALNLCGRFDVRELCNFIADLDLLITPDTGPMHIATWTNTPVLNLSLGPVNPWETGPFSPGHHVIRADVPCLGCWRCSEDRIKCKQSLTARHVGHIARALLENAQELALPTTVRNVQVHVTRRERHGLFDMQQVFTGSARNQTLDLLAASRIPLAEFWRSWFGNHFGLFETQDVAVAWHNLSQESPDMAGLFKEATTSFLGLLAGTLKKRSDTLLTDQDFWERAPSLIRPLSGYCQMYTQNEKGSKQSLLHILSLAEKLVAGIT